MSPATDAYGRPTPVSYPSADPYRAPAERYESKPRHDPPAPQLSEQEFEEIFQRNKTVSSSAISRAVQDASAGMLYLIEYSLSYLCQQDLLDYQLK